MLKLVKISEILETLVRTSVFPMTGFSPEFYLAEPKETYNIPLMCNLKRSYI